MTQFISLTFRFLPNAAHFNFCTQVNFTLSNAGATVLMSLGDLPVQFGQWYEKETALMEWIRKSELTKLIAEADKRIDRALVAISSHVKAEGYSPLPNISEAARRVGIMLKNYGYIYQKPYEQQEGDIRTILMQLSGDYNMDAMVLNLDAWITELQTSFTEFQQLLAQRDTRSLQKPKDSFPTVRRGIEKIYHQTVKIVNAGSLLNISPDYEVFINKLNPEINRLNTEFHHTRRNIIDAEPSPIPQQEYTGYPVTPTPDVFYAAPNSDPVKLQLGKDYNLSYKNNKNAGNAQCTLHGKGKYTGRKTVTFIIFR
ncbi:MAG: DUF6261 family protein [Bacteroidales bacterium]|jgi:hypothetical protein|nr:DUF6261 family protein [Bacteroidales bacterium]